MTAISILDVRNRCAEKSWEIFNKYLEQTPALNGLYMHWMTLLFLDTYGFLALRFLIRFVNRWEDGFLLQGPWNSPSPSRYVFGCFLQRFFCLKETICWASAFQSLLVSNIIFSGWWASINHLGVSIPCHCCWKLCLWVLWCFRNKNWGDRTLDATRAVWRELI